MKVLSLGSQSQCLPTTNQQTSRNLIRRIDHYVQNHERGYARIARIRKTIETNPSSLHKRDHVLAYPEQYKNSIIRGLIHVSKHLEELGESVADISGVTERLARNMISSGEKTDLAQVIASAVGRILACQLTFPGFAVHKALGSGLYIFSVLMSCAALTLANSKYGALRSESTIQQAPLRPHFDSHTYLYCARKLLSTKEQLLEKLLDKTGSSNNQAMHRIQKWGKSMSRRHRSVPDYLTSRRQTHSNYMWNNLHQYGPVTQALMNFSYLTFQGINKLFVSGDKYLGTEIGTRFLKKQLGNVLSCRFGLAISITLHAAISIPLSPFVIGISTIGAAACATALLALLLAKLNVRVCNDWHGNIAKSV